MKSVLSLPGVHYFARRFGWPTLRAAALNARFKSGEWTALKEHPAFAAIVEKYIRGGDALMMGCGANPLGEMLDQNTYKTIIGVDLSERAINLARENALPRQSFFVGDMLTVKCQGPFDCIVFPESIYYLPFGKIAPMLDRLTNCLTPHGSIIVSIVQPDRYCTILGLIRGRYKVLIDEPIIKGRARHIIVFQKISIKT